MNFFSNDYSKYLPGFSVFALPKFLNGLCCGIACSGKNPLIGPVMRRVIGNINQL
jgi:hypothetical protein